LVGFCRVCGGGKEFVSIKSCILESYCSVGMMTRVLPLSARVIVALLRWSLDFMLLMVLASCWTLGVGGCLLSRCSVVMRSATCFLYMSRSAVGKCVIAVSASKAKFSNQLLHFVCSLYLSPFCSRVVSASENGILDIFTTRG